MVYIYRCNNTEVTNFYLNVIGDMFLKNGEAVYDYNANINDKDAIIVASSPVHFLKFYLKGYRNIVLWMQGIEPEESYLKNKKYLNKRILEILAKFSLKRAKLVFYVSEEMKNHQAKKYRISTDNRDAIMPCFNDIFHEELLSCPGKYEKNIFAYVGSINVWQCFEETIDTYKKLEALLVNTELKVLTFSVEEAKKIIESKGVKNYSIECVSPEMVAQKLSNVKFGFVIRENIDVNNVATPTKISSYLSAGVIPIVSDCVKDFAKIASAMDYAVVLPESKELPKKLVDLCKNNINVSNIVHEYKTLFNTYYNPQFYIKKYSQLIHSITLQCDNKK